MDSPGFEFQKGQETSSLLYDVQVGCGVQTASCSIGTAVFCGGKRPRSDSDHSPPSIADLIKGIFCLYTSWHRQVAYNFTFCILTPCSLFYQGLRFSLWQRAIWKKLSVKFGIFSSISETLMSRIWVNKYFGVPYTVQINASALFWNIFWTRVTRVQKIQDLTRQFSPAGAVVNHFSIEFVC